MFPLKTTLKTVLCQLGNHLKMNEKCLLMQFIFYTSPYSALTDHFPCFDLLYFQDLAEGMYIFMWDSNWPILKHSC